MSKFIRLRRDEDGAAAIEFAIAVPVLIFLIYGIFRIGLLFEANAGMQHALGEGARLATLFPTPTDAQITTRMNNRLFGNGYGTFTVATPVTSAGADFKTLTITYTTPMDFLLVPGPTVTLTRSKVVYLPVAS
jgi:Flp pilus assembly protein TadG